MNCSKRNNVSFTSLIGTLSRTIVKVIESGKARKKNNTSLKAIVLTVVSGTVHLMRVSEGGRAREREKERVGES